MTLSGLFSSWATPETSWPTADIFAACTSCTCVSLRRAKLSRALAYRDRKSTRLNSSHEWISYAVFCLKKKKKIKYTNKQRTISTRKTQTTYTHNVSQQ